MVSVVGSTLTTSSSAETSFVINMPSTRPDDDLYIVFLGLGDSGTAEEQAADVTSLPSNWTGVHNNAQRSAGRRIRCRTAYWVGDSEPASYELSLDASVEPKFAVVVQFTGYDGADPIRSSAGAESNEGPTCTAPSVTTDQDTTEVLRMVGIRLSGDTMVSGPDTLLQLGTDSGGDIGFGVSHETGPNPAGASGVSGDFEFTGFGPFPGAATVRFSIAVNDGSEGEGSPLPPPPAPSSTPTTDKYLLAKDYTVS